MTSASQPDKQHIAVFSPYLQGFYLGEIVDQIRQLCSINNYKFTAIRTDGLATFDIPLGVSHFTGVIILKNAISPALADRILTMGIPVVSIAYDYYPLEIPVVGCDNEQAVALAYNYLKELGHNQIAYVGDFSQYDLRKRFEYFGNLCDQDSNSNSDVDTFYPVDNSLYRGGLNAAKAFLKRGDTSTAVICGAGLTAIGFYEKINKSNRKIDVVGFDATSITPIYAPNIVAVDQNLHLIAHKALAVIKNIQQQEEVQREELVPARLILPNENKGATLNDYMVTCTEKNIFANPNYAKALITNNYEWTKQIIDSNLDELMSIYPVFRDFMQAGLLCRTKPGANNETQLIATRAYTESETINLVSMDPPLSFSADTYPVEKHNSHIFIEGMINTHFPITVGGKSWGVLSFSGPANLAQTNCSYMGFTSYVDTITQNLANVLLAKTVLKTSE